MDVSVDDDHDGWMICTQYEERQGSMLPTSIQSHSWGTQNEDDDDDDERHQLRLALSGLACRVAIITTIAGGSGLLI